MASRLLNSGELNNYFAIGEDGVLVWQRADAFRSSIITSEQLGQKYADYLAVPRFTADGSHVDWFIPFLADNKNGEYSVVAWPAASEDEKKKAIEELNHLNEKFLNYGYNLQARALNSNDRLFAHFLTGNKNSDSVNPAIHFPDENCVYIVNGRPVITFWGFLNRGDKLTGDPFERLRAPLLTAAPIKPAAATATVAPVAAANHKWCYFLLPLLLLLLPLLLYLLWWWFFARGLGLPAFKTFPDLFNFSLDPVNRTVEADPYHKVLQPDGTYVVKDGATNTKIPDDGVVREDALSDLNATDETVPDNASVEPYSDPAEEGKTEESLPDETESQVPDTQENLEPNIENKDDSNNKDDLSQNVPVPPQLSDEGPALSNSDLSSGDISKLDGNWKVNSPIVDKNTNKPLQLEYNFKDGKGEAVISQKNGVKCKGAVNGGLSGGSFTIDGNSTAKCTDGSTYIMPKVVCKPGKDGNSDCTSIYDGAAAGSKKSEFPMTIHR